MTGYDLWGRGKNDDPVLFYLSENNQGVPNLTVLVAANVESMGLRAVRADQYGRLLINPSLPKFTIINKILADVVADVYNGAPIFRQVDFYAKDANMNIGFQMQDGTRTAEMTVVPNVPFHIGGVFISIFAHNTSAGVVSTLQAVVSYDNVLGQANQ